MRFNLFFAFVGALDWSSHEKGKSALTDTTQVVPVSMAEDDAPTASGVGQKAADDAMKDEGDESSAASVQPRSRSATVMMEKRFRAEKKRMEEEQEKLRQVEAKEERARKEEEREAPKVEQKLMTKIAAGLRAEHEKQVVKLATARDHAVAEMRARHAKEIQRYSETKRKELRTGVELLEGEQQQELTELLEQSGHDVQHLSEDQAQQEDALRHKYHDPQEGCHTMVKGDPCYEAVLWAKTKGVHNHPEWYRGLSGKSSHEDFQELLSSQGRKVCRRPCREAAQSSAPDLSSAPDPSSAADPSRRFELLGETSFEEGEEHASTEPEGSHSDLTLLQSETFQEDELSGMRTAFLEAAKKGTGAMLVMLEEHQACYFDNFVAALARIENWSLPVFVVTLGSEAENIFNAVNSNLRHSESGDAMRQKQSSIELICLRNSKWKGSIDSSAVGRYGSKDFFSIGWTRVAVAEFATRLGVRLVVSDLDNVFLKDPSAALKPFLDRPRPFAMRDHKLNNLGVWAAGPGSNAELASWLQRRKGDPKVADSDNERFNEQFPVDTKVPTFLPDIFMSAGDYGRKGGQEAVSVHCFAVYDKKKCLMEKDLWHPIGDLPCKYTGR